MNFRFTMVTLVFTPQCNSYCRMNDSLILFVNSANKNSLVQKAGISMISFDNNKGFTKTLIQMNFCIHLSSSPDKYSICD